MQADENAMDISPRLHLLLHLSTSLSIILKRKVVGLIGWKDFALM
jgi:hypothetical protein